MKRIVPFLILAVFLSALAALPAFAQTNIPEYGEPKEVKIYLPRANADKSGLELSPVRRVANSNAPLRSTLEFLFEGPTEEERLQGFAASTFGMKFVVVVLKNGTALIRFSQPKNQIDYESLSPTFFVKSIEATAMQFPAVKKVEICAVGETRIDSKLEKPFPKCPK
jgi:spore germination protein GerM